MTRPKRWEVAGLDGARNLFIGGPPEQLFALGFSVHDVR